MRRLALPVLFALGFLAAGGFSTAVIASTTSTGTSTGTTTTETTTTTPTTTTTTPTPKTLPPGITISGVGVGGMTIAEATDAVRTAAGKPVLVRVKRHR